MRYISIQVISNTLHPMSNIPMSLNSRNLLSFMRGMSRKRNQNKKLFDTLLPSSADYQDSLVHE